jgi:chitin synthase
MLCLVQGNFFISFFVLTNALEDPEIIGGKAIDLVNTIFRYSYVGLLLSCFILSLGNRPQGSNVGYTLAFVGYAIFTVYMTVGQPRLSSTQESQLMVWQIQFAAIILSVKGVQQVAAAEHRGASLSDLFSNSIFRDIVLSLSATIGLYVVASIIHVRDAGLKIPNGC